jgi:phospholipid/cholesterol/gamma-HCH transport system permease protein
MVTRRRSANLGAAALAAIGRTGLELVRFLGGAAQLLADMARQMASGRVSLRHTVEQMAVIGTDSIPIALLTVFFAGMVLALHTAKDVVAYGASGLLGGLVAVSLARELGPTLTSIVVAARVGSAMAAEIGSMVVTEQVDALRSLAVSPVRYLVAPRVIAAVVSLPLLTIITEMAGATGAFIVASQWGVSWPEYISSVERFLTAWDLYGGLGKTAVFGLIVSLVGCWQGLSTRGGAAGVGRSTTAAVVMSIVLIYGANFVLSDFLLRVARMLSP